MRLRRLDLTRYGKFTDYSIDFGVHQSGAPDLHIVYGLNEAGKTTSLSAYLDLLFGIEERTRYGFLHQSKAMEVGGCLEFGGTAHEFKRLKQRSNSLIDADGQPVNEALLGAPLAGLTRESYRTMFSLDDQTLEEGGNAILESKGDLGELLFSASAGLAEISSTLQAVGEAADGIFRKRASTTTIAVLKKRIAELKSRRDGLDTQASAHAALVAALKSAEKAYDEAMRERADARSRHEELARILRAHPLAANYRRTREELEAFAGLPRPPAQWASELPAMMTDEARLQTRLTGLDQREQILRRQIAEIEIDRQILALSERLEGIGEAAARFTTAEDDLPKRRAALAERNLQVEVILATLGQAGHANAKLLLVPAPVIGALRDLIAERSGVDVAAEAARREHESALRVLEQAREDRRELEGDGAALKDGHAARLEAILARLRQSDLPARLRVAERAVPQRKRQFEETMAALAPWQGDGDALGALACPAQRQIETWRAALDSLEKRRAGHEERIRDLVTRLQTDRARIEAIRSAAGEIDDDEAAHLLGEREEAWRRHLDALDPVTARAFEAKMREVDGLAESRLSGARNLAELRTLTQSLAVLDVEIARQKELLDETGSELADLRAEIAANVPAGIGLAETAAPGTWLIHLERWMKARDEALAAWREFRDARDDVSEAETEAEREHRELADALNAAGMASEDVPFAALVQAAETALSADSARKTARTAADNRVRDEERGLAARKQDFDDAEALNRAWQDRWRKALTNTWFADRAESTGVVREILDALSDLPAALREHSEIEHRIEAMEADRESFVTEIAALHAELGESPETATLQSARALMRRHEEARRHLEASRQKEADLAGLADERESLSEEIALHAARKAELTAFFGVTALAEVSTEFDRCAARDGLESLEKDLSAQIASEMQAETLQAALDRLDGTDLAAVQRDHIELGARLEDLDEHAKELFADKSRAADRLAEIGGDDAVARVEAERKTALVEIEDQALKFLRLRTGGLIAEHAIRAYRDKHRSSMMERASEAFSLITRGEYTGLATRPEKEREALIGLSRNGGSKLAVDMSKGTRFQLYLALRLAGYEEFAAARPPVPFVADDIMETFDEPRSEEVFRLLGEMAKIGQVIYLTHHRHLCEIAAQVVPGVRIHEIAS